jgi:cystathionine beta-synthase
MRDRNFLEEGTFMTAEEIIRHKTKKGIAHLSPQNTLAEAIQIMRDTGISQLPVLSDTHVVGSINESRLLNALIDDPKMRNEPLHTVMSDPFPFVLPSTRMDVISKMISKDSPAVLVKGFDGELDIITKHDLITVLAGKA